MKPANRSESQCLCKTIRSTNTSGFRGVSCVFDNPELAAAARDAEAIKLHGEFARLNKT